MSRGSYRGVYSALFDDPDYQRLGSRTRHVLLTVRQCRDCGPAGIFVFYPEVTARQTGYHTRQILDAMTELEQAGWVVHECPVLWIRNALRHDPYMSLANPKHRIAVQRYVEGLPHLNIVLTFCDYYQIAYPFDTHSIGFPAKSANGPTSTSTSTKTIQRNEDETSIVGPSPDVMALNGYRHEAEAVLAFLNAKTGRTFRPTAGNLTLIEARLKAGASPSDCRGVIVRKVRAWATDPKMAQYLRPATLFNATKFDQYIGEQGS